MVATAPDVYSVVHSHWCPGCESAWECEHTYAQCPLDGSVVAVDHCDRREAWEDLD